MAGVKRTLKRAKKAIKDELSAIRGSSVRRYADQTPIITQPTGFLPLEGAKATFVIVTGPRFDQNIPNATMTERQGLAGGFEKLGIPYLFTSHHNLKETLSSISNPFCLTLGSDYEYFPGEVSDTLKNYKHFVWVTPWFEDSDIFFEQHKLYAPIWTWPTPRRRKILRGQPRFVCNATVPSGMHFFEEWENHGVPVVSLPFACDTDFYNPSVAKLPEFENIEMAFVGGYWDSKAQQIDPYLRPFEDKLRIYGYSKWPYRGYRGQISREAEPSLYKQAKVCPTINEPTVKLLHGQINERVFKIMGCGGVTVVDAIPQYRQLFTEDELPIPRNVDEFKDMVNALLEDDTLRKEQAEKGYKAVMQRHTYEHRARLILKHLNMENAIAEMGDDKT